MANIREVFSTAAAGFNDTPTRWALTYRPDPVGQPNRHIVRDVIVATRREIKRRDDAGAAGPNGAWGFFDEIGAFHPYTFAQEDPHNHPADPGTPKQRARAGVGDRYRAAERDFVDRPEQNALTDAEKERRRLRRLEQQAGVLVPPEEQFDGET